MLVLISVGVIGVCIGTVFQRFVIDGLSEMEDEIKNLEAEAVYLAHLMIYDRHDSISIERDLQEANAQLARKRFLLDACLPPCKVVK